MQRLKHPQRVVIIGAGVIGLACARALAMHGLEVYILEKHTTIGSETSSRNSEVIHAGIYYPPNSLKARLCRQGRDLLFEYCLTKKIPHLKTGKLIVATKPSEIDALQALKNNAEHNHVTDLEYLSKTDLQKYYPFLKAELALFSPSTGILNSHELMSHLLCDAEMAGAQLVLNTNVKNISIKNNQFILHTEYLENNTIQKYDFETNFVINSAGLEAHKIAGYLNQKIPEIKYYKGSYFSYQCDKKTKELFNTLIYPVPEKNGLGIHLTMDLNGQIKFGPDVEYIDLKIPIDYDVFIYQQKKFIDSIMRYYPDIRSESLIPDYSGIRPKAKNHDFNIITHVYDQLKIINFLGIDSPGLTSCFALAAQIAL